MGLSILHRLIKIITIAVIFALLSTTFINLKRKPEESTELYFSNHLTLPRQIETGKSYSFEFTTNNIEYKELRYIYEVTVSNNEVNSTISLGEFVLSPGQIKTVPINFIFSSPFKRMKVTVKLVNKNQEINFWVDEI